MLYQIQATEAMSTPALHHLPVIVDADTSMEDSVFQSPAPDDFLDDVFYDDPMPTSAMATTATDFPAAMRHRPAGADQVDNARLHPLSFYCEAPLPCEKR